MAQLAFGTYRISDTDPNHIAAIRMAVESGVQMIDTSTNYMDGHAEQAIALALHALPEAVVKKVEIVSKFGYVQGATMQRLKEEETFHNVVQYAEHVWHCIDPDFMKDQLTQSLSRLGREVIDCYLVHNPEYFLLDALRRNVSKEERLDEMLQRIYDAFIGLEQEVKAGRIKSYGISSNSFALPSNNDEFLPYEDLVTLAENAANYVGNEAHAFTTLQLPINLLEQEGLKCAAWAKRKGLQVLANRPLNAQQDGRTFRLATYEEPRDYHHHLNAMLELCEGDEGLQPLYNLLLELDANRHRFGWVGDYEQFFYARIVPHLQGVFVGLEASVRRSVAESLDHFFAEYADMVAFECSQTTAAALAESFGNCQGNMQECALRFLLDQPSIDYVVSGMRKPAYVAQFTALT